MNAFERPVSITRIWPSATAFRVALDDVQRHQLEPPRRSRPERFGRADDLAIFVQWLGNCDRRSCAVRRCVRVFKAALGSAKSVRSLDRAKNHTIAASAAATTIQRASFMAAALRLSR